MGSRDDLALGLPTLDKILEPNLPEPLPSLTTSVKKKPYSIIVLTIKAKLKKKINGDIGERLKGQLSLSIYRLMLNY